MKIRLKQIFENNEIIYYSKSLDRCCFYSKNKIDGFKLKIIESEIVIRHNFHVENCGKLIYEKIN